MSQSRVDPHISWPHVKLLVNSRPQYTPGGRYGEVDRAPTREGVKGRIWNEDAMLRKLHKIKDDLLRTEFIQSQDSF